MCGTKFAVMNPSCDSCMESINRLKIDNKHIYEEHFDRADVENVSSFYHDISLLMVFDIFKAKLRAGILKGYVQHRSKKSRGSRRSRRSRRLIYHCPLDFVVGTFPVRRRGRVMKRHETCYVKVVCATSKCRNHFCRRLAPKLVITMFPFRDCN